MILLCTVDLIKAIHSQTNSGGIWSTALLFTTLQQVVPLQWRAFVHTHVDTLTCGPQEN